MPFIPLGQKLFANVDEIGNTVAVTSRVDVVLDDLKNNVPRFRLALFAETGEAAQIDGLFRFQNYSFNAAVCNGKLYKIEEDGTVTEIPIDGGAGSLSLNTRASMADFGDWGYFANNSAIVKWDLRTLVATTVADEDAPTNATALTFFDSYLLASIADSGRYEWSDVGDPDTWLGEFATAGTKPDNITGINSAFGEIFLPGTDTLEYWADLGDELNPFARLPGTLTERGVLAPYSVVQADNTYFFLDQQRRVIRLEGRAPRVISNPIDKEIQGLSVVTDAIGFDMSGEGQTLYFLTFPTAARTFAYNYKTDDWSEFSYWNDANGKREAFLASSAVFNPTWDKTLLGSRKADGKIYYATFDQKTDEGAPVRGEIVTGRIDWKAPSREKECELLVLTLKRGTSGLEGDDSIFFQFRDNGTTQWGTMIELKLGNAGDQLNVLEIARLGSYRNRQWRFILPSVDTVLVSAEETIKV